MAAKTMSQRRRSNITVHRDTVRKAGVLAAMQGTTIGNLVEAMIDERYQAANLPQLPEIGVSEALAS